MAEPIKKYKLGLLGHPVAHSQSPRIHAEFAQQFGIQLDYELIDVSVDELQQKFKDWIRNAYGCNITVPHKQNIIPFLDHCTERARLAQAVNTVFWRNGELWGDNTDGDGLILDLENKGVVLSDAQILIIGAGGATQGIIPSLLAQGVAHIDIKNRDNEKAKNLEKQYERCAAIGTKNLTAKNYNLIIHATSMGHHGLSPELQHDWIDSKTVVYDLSYGQAAEPFLKAAKALGAKQAFDGLGMLIGQAALAFEIWFERRPEI